MTQTFWLTASVLILLAMCFIVAPLVFHRSGRRASLDLRNQNLLAYRSRFEELDRELDSGALDQESYRQLREELQGGLLEDVPDADRGVLASPQMVKGGKSAFVVVLAGLIALPAAAVFFYDRWGAMDELEQFLTMQEMANTDGGRFNQMQGLAQQLREKLEAQPDNSDGWAMLGRTYMNLEQYPDAAWAFERLAESINDNPMREATAWGLAAQSLFFQNEGAVAGGVSQAIEMARSLNPDEVNSLGLLGIGGFSEHIYQKALEFWERIVEVAPDHPQVASIQQGIAQAYQRLGEEPPTAAGAGDTPEASPGVTVRVEIDPAFDNAIADDTPLFVFARPAGTSGGPPLAVARLTAGQLPTVIRLDDRSAMSPQARISDVTSVEVQARISRSGDATPRPGDWQGQVADPISVTSATEGDGSDAVTLVIDTQLTD
jgi:cytochrome c-type biogenesis protein CcmH